MRPSSLVAVAALAGAGWGAGRSTPPGFLAPPSDTTLAARRGDVLLIETLEGRLVVQGWDQDRVALVGGGELRRAGQRIGLAGGRRRPREGVVRLSVPRWMQVSVSGGELEVDVRALEAPVGVRVLEGDVRVSDVRGPVVLRAVDGEILVEGVTGSVEAAAVSDRVVVREVRGDVRVESTDGDVVLRDVDGLIVEALTVDGDVVFDGVVRPGGHYRLVTHDGDVTALVPEGAGARVSVSTYDGEFLADVPVTLDGYRGGREMTFTLGAGGATLAMEAFDGDIRLGWRR